MPFSRIELIRSVLLIAGAAAFAGPWSAGAAERPNILFIMTDQQHSGMMGCSG